MGLDYIKERKKELKMTTEELSSKSGVPLGTLNKILAGQTNDPKFQTLKAICKALDLKLSDLDDTEPASHAAHHEEEKWNTMTIGKRIKARRQELALSAEDIAEIMGVSPSTIYRYESMDIANMGIDKIQPIADALKTSVSYLMGWPEVTTIEAHHEEEEWTPEELTEIEAFKDYVRSKRK